MSEEKNEETGAKPAKRPAKRTTKRVAKRARKSANEPATGDDEPKPQTAEPAAASDARGEDAAPTASKRPKRRRGKKGKGGGEVPQEQERNQPQEAETEHDEGATETRHGGPFGESGAEPSNEDSKPRENTHTTRQREASRQQPRHDPAELSRKAWKIYLAEVSEEGIALINDNDARDIARRCFRMASIFLDEQARQR